MTTDEKTISKIKAHLIEFPEDKAADIENVFDVDVKRIYELKEHLRRHGMLPRAGMKRRRSAGKLRVVDAPKEKPVSSNYEVVLLKAEIARLKAIIDYLEAASGIKKAA